MPYKKICPKCGTPYAEHLQCALCRIFVGPNHVLDYVETAEGQVICTQCAGDIERGLPMKKPES